MSSKRVLSGIQPTHDSFHLGNYLGALKQWVELQENNDAFYCVVDLHALTVGDWSKASSTKNFSISCSINRNRNWSRQINLVCAVSSACHNQLAWVFECITGFGEASRMTQFKDKSQKGGAERTNVGLLPIQFASLLTFYFINQILCQWVKINASMLN